MHDPTEALFTTPEMAAIWSGEAQVQKMLAFEAALARAEARAGVIPADAADAIAAACRVERFDVAALFHEAATAGTAAIPLTRMLTERVTSNARGFVHWGATSQDVLDTALVLQMRAGLDLLTRRLWAVGAACAALAERYRETPMVGRTVMLQALPITFGLKAARWLALTTRQIGRLVEARERISVVQFGGAAGTLASLGTVGIQVTDLLAEELGIAAPDLPWHTERDRVAEVAATLGVVAGSMAKIAHDLMLMAQTEVAEVSEAARPGKGGSSAMPQKRNPVDAMMALAASRLALGALPIVFDAMAQEHERAAGGWQAEWGAIPALFRSTAGTVERTRNALDGLDVDIDSMRANLERSGGMVMAESLTMALAARIGKHEAYQLVRAATERARRDAIDLQQAAQREKRIKATLTPDEIAAAFDPSSYLGSAQTYITRALDDFHTLRAPTSGETMDA